MSIMRRKTGITLLFLLLALSTLCLLYTSDAADE